MYIDPDSSTSSHLSLVSTPLCTDSNSISFLPGLCVLLVLLVPHLPPWVQVVGQCRLPLGIGRQEVKEGTISANHISPLDPRHHVLHLAHLHRYARWRQDWTYYRRSLSATRIG